MTRFTAFLIGLVTGAAIIVGADQASARDGSKSVSDRSASASQAKGDDRNTSKKEQEASFDQQYRDWREAYEAWQGGAEDEETLDNFTDGATMTLEVNEAKQNKEISKDYELPDGGAGLDIFN